MPSGNPALLEDTDYAAALRTAHARVAEYQAYAKRAAVFQGSVSPAMSAWVEAELRTLRADAEESLTALDVTAQAAEAAVQAPRAVTAAISHACRG
jgi:7-keto-8-aminopelargonate synthetase-like enzyme